MKNIRISWSESCVLVALCLGPAPAHAQFGFINNLLQPFMRSAERFFRSNTATATHRLRVSILETTKYFQNILLSLLSGKCYHARCHAVLWSCLSTFAALNHWYRFQKLLSASRSFRLLPEPRQNVHDKDKQSLVSQLEPSIVDSSCWGLQESLLRSVDDLLSSWPGLMDHKLHTISRWCLGVRIDNIWNKSGPENVTSINTSQTLSQSAPAPPSLNSKRLP